MIDEIVKSDFRRSSIGVDLEDNGNSEFNTIQDHVEYPWMWILDDKAGEDDQDRRMMLGVDLSWGIHLFQESSGTFPLFEGCR